ncbi:granzyme A-like isoform X2 [Lissotriton helveticus]
MRLSVSLAAASAALVFLIIPGDQCTEIIGGTEVAPHSRPYMALIRDKRPVICGGTLIKDGWVLTAAHCNIKKTSKVILGVHFRCKKEAEQQTFTIKQSIPHPSFNRNTRDNDIMLLQLNKKVKRSKAVCPFPPPGKGADVKERTVCEAAGWGLRNSEDEKPSNALMAVNLTVVSRTTCNDHYKSKPIITMNMLCAGDKHGGKDTCDGDSGGPLICNRELRGITSFGPRICGQKKPAVYTLLTDDYLSWIRKMTGADL